MQKRTVQISLYDIYKGVSESIEDKKPEIIRLLEEHLDFDSLIPAKFIQAYYKGTGRKHIYHLESLVRALILQKLLGIQTDTLLITFLKCSSELRKFCGFNKIPDGSKFTRFRQDYGDMLVKMFDHLVDLTEPICREIDSKKSDYLIYDTTGIEPPVCENNPKFFNSKLKSAKKLSKTDPDFNPYIGVYGLLPDVSSANPNAKQQYINGHFAYALKSGIVTNGLGIIRHISFLTIALKTNILKRLHKKRIIPTTTKN